MTKPRRAISAYEVHTFMIGEGWVNTWIVHHPDGSSEPERFATQREAKVALREFIRELKEEAAVGNLHDAGAEFRVARWLGAGKEDR